MYSIPNLPEFPDQEKFKGEIMPAESFSDIDNVKGKNVIVVGAGKSGIDSAVVAAKYGEKSTLLLRLVHWPAPTYLADRIPLPWFTYSRFVNFTMPMHYDVTPFHKMMHTIGGPIKWLYWRTLELIFKK